MMRESERPSLQVLSNRVRDARIAVSRLRLERITPATMLDARHCLMTALVDYITELERHGLPVPRALKSELDLYQDVFS